MTQPHDHFLRSQVEYGALSKWLACRQQPSSADKYTQKQFNLCNGIVEYYSQGKHGILILNNLKICFQHECIFNGKKMYPHSSGGICIFMHIHCFVCLYLSLLSQRQQQIAQFGGLKHRGAQHLCRACAAANQCMHTKWVKIFMHDFYQEALSFHLSPFFIYLNSSLSANVVNSVEFYMCTVHKLLLL